MLLGPALAFVAAISFVGFDVVRKRLAVHDAGAVTAALSLLQGALFSLWWCWESIEAAQLVFAVPTTSYVLPGSLCVALNVIAGVLFVRSLALSPFSRTIPLLSLSPVFAALGGAVVLREIPTITQGSGIALAVFGALLINADRASGRLWGPFRAVYQERGSFLMVLVAVAWAFTLVLDKECLNHSEPAAHATIQNLGVALVLLLVLVLSGSTGRLKPLRKEGGPLLLAAVLGCSALGFQLVALKLVFAAVVETIKRGVGVVASVVVGRVLFAEPITRYKVLGAVLIVAGTTTLAFST